MRAAVLVVATAASADDAPWKFLASYPAQLDALPCENVTIDGVLDEPCWQKAPWTGPFEDIAQPLHPGARIPDSYQTTVAVAYSSDSLYVAAVLRRETRAVNPARPSTPVVRSQRCPTSSRVHRRPGPVARACGR